MVKLEACRVGSRWLTSGAPVARLVLALTTAAERTVAMLMPPNRTLSALRWACEKTLADLATRGA